MGFVSNLIIVVLLVSNASANIRTDFCASWPLASAGSTASVKFKKYKLRLLPVVFFYKDKKKRKREIDVSIL